MYNLIKIILLIILGLSTNSTEAQQQEKSNKKNQQQTSAIDTFSLFFDVGSDKLIQKTVYQLDSLGSLLKGKEKIQIIGYADKRGKINANYILSERRAKNIQKHLIQNGVSTSCINLIANGMEESENNDIAFQKARRVDVVYSTINFNCSDSIFENKIKPFYFVFNQSRYEDNASTDIKKLAYILKKTPCLKATLYIYKICENCKSYENISVSDTAAIEDESLVAVRRTQIISNLKSSGVSDRQISFQKISLGCLSKINKSFLKEIKGNDEEIIKRQRRVDIKLSKL